MAEFYNQASLSFRGVLANSNRTAGVISGGSAFDKIAVSQVYSPGARIVYALSVTNDTDAPMDGLTVSDDLGAYLFDAQTLYPLQFAENSLRFFLNGVLQPADALTVTPGPPLEIAGLSLPAGANAVLVYEAEVTAFAPMGEGAQIVNTATLDGGSLPLTAQATVPAAQTAVLSIAKSMDPLEIAENGQLTYTFVLQNTGTAATTPADAVALTDVFEPTLSGLVVTLDGAALTEGTDYTYGAASGTFTTVPGAITVPGAAFAQTPTGEWIMTPGAAVLRVTGTI